MKTVGRLFFNRLFIVIVFCFSFIETAQSKTLQTTSLLFPQEPMLVFGWESDLFTNPLETKESAFKSYHTEATFPVLRDSEWKPLVIIKAESTSVAQAGLTVGDDKVLVNKALLYRAAGVGLLKSMNDAGYVKIIALYGSASDEPFLSGRDEDIDLNFQYFSSLKNNGQWVVVVSSTKNRGYLNGKTIPLLGYRYVVNSDFNLTVGTGFLHTQWQPTPEESVTFLMVPVGYSLNYSKQLPMDLLWINETGLTSKSFMHTTRTEDDMRLFLEYKYIKSGFELTLTERSRLGIDFGLTFDRKIYEGKQIFLPVGSGESFVKQWYGSFVWRFNL